MHVHISRLEQQIHLACSTRSPLSLSLTPPSSVVVSQSVHINHLTHLSTSFPTRSLLLGEVKVTNALRELMTCFQKGQIPKKWRSQYVVSARMGLSTWIADLAARGSELGKYRPVLAKSSSPAVAVGKISAVKFWIGGMFLPEGLITATRQQCAQVGGIVRAWMACITD